MQAMNFFSDMFKQPQNQEQMFNWFKGLNYNQSSNMNNTLQKNSEALVKAGQVSSENMQAMLRRCGEVMQQSISEVVSVSRNVMAAGNPEQALQKQQEYLKESAVNALNHSKEMIDMGAKSMMEVFDIFSQGISRNVQEAQSMAASNIVKFNDEPEVMTNNNNLNRKK